MTGPHAVYVETPADNYLTHVVATTDDSAAAAEVVRDVIATREHGNTGVIWPDGTVTNVRF